MAESVCRDSNLKQHTEVQMQSLHCSVDIRAMSTSMRSALRAPGCMGCTGLRMGLPGTSDVH